MLLKSAGTAKRTGALLRDVPQWLWLRSRERRTASLSFACPARCNDVVFTTTVHGESRFVFFGHNRRDDFRGRVKAIGIVHGLLASEVPKQRQYSHTVRAASYLIRNRSQSFIFANELFLFRILLEIELCCVLVS